jgi:hypothetical protein
LDRDKTSKGVADWNCARLDRRRIVLRRGTMVMMTPVASGGGMMRGRDLGEGHDGTVQQAHKSEHHGEGRAKQAISGAAHAGTCKWNLVTAPTSNGFMDKILDSVPGNPIQRR